MNIYKNVPFGKSPINAKIPKLIPLLFQSFIHKMQRPILAPSFAPIVNALMCWGLALTDKRKGTLSTTYELGSQMDSCILLAQNTHRTGETLLITIWDSEVEHRGLTPSSVPGPCGDEDKMSERHGQVATAIVPPWLREYWTSTDKITAARVSSRKTFYLFWYPSGCRSRGLSFL